MQAQLPTDECQAFRNCISTYIQRTRRRLEKNLMKINHRSTKKQQHSISLVRLPQSYLKHCRVATHLSNHAIHILTTLYIKRHSLSLAIEAFYKVCNDCISILQRQKQQQYQQQQQQQQQQSSFRTILQEILTHIFIQYIHIRDGFVLLTSGECRHLADSNLAKKNRAERKGGGVEAEVCAGDNVAFSEPHQKRKLSHQQHKQEGGSENDSGDNNDEDTTKNQFYSKLSELAVRKDGYTKLFSSNCGYSGYGWDEFFNEEVGVRKRLLDALRLLSSYNSITSYRSNNSRASDENLYDEDEDEDREIEFKAKQERDRIWDTLIDMGGGAELFESAFDKHDSHMKELQRQLERYRTVVLTKLQQILSSSSFPFSSNKGIGTTNVVVEVIMVTEDKFEKLQLKNAKALGLNINTWMIQRQGNIFQGKTGDKRGALPSHISLKDWLQIMKLPSSLVSLYQNNKNIKNKNVEECNNNNSKTSQRKKHQLTIVDREKDVQRKKKRLVIMDSSDDDDDNTDDNGVVVEDNMEKTTKRTSNQSNIITIANATCSHINNHKNDNNERLKVTIEEVVHDEKANATSSLHDIKKQLGVNINELQRAREELEEEEQVSKKAAFMDETGDGGEEDATISKNSPHSITRNTNFIRLNNRREEVAVVPGNFNVTNLRPEGPIPRNDIFRNAAIAPNKEPTSRVIIAGDYRNTTYKKKEMPLDQSTRNSDAAATVAADKDFRSFGIHMVVERTTEENMKEEVLAKTAQFCEWGDEVIEASSLKPGSHSSYTPEKPIEMIQDLGLE